MPARYIVLTLCLLPILAGYAIVSDAGPIRAVGRGVARVGRGVGRGVAWTATLGHRRQRLERRTYLSDFGPDTSAQVEAAVDQLPRLTPPAVTPPAVERIATTESNSGLIAAGKAFPGAHCFDGPQHPLLQQQAQKAADYQARVCQQGHQVFMRETFRLVSQQLGLGAAEICAESWPWQSKLPYDQLGKEMFRCWRNWSPGHWRVAAKKHRYWGAAMSKGRNGIWYCAITVAD